MNAFVQKLPRAYSVMKLHLNETPLFQERMKIEQLKCHYFTVEIRSGLSEKTF